MTVTCPPDRAARVGQLAAVIVALLNDDFAWAEAEAKKVADLAAQLKCAPDVAGRLLVFFLLYVSAYRKEVSVADLPQVLARFPVKWGYKKKRHDFLKTLQAMDFIFVETDYWAKVRAKKYGLGKAGEELLARILARVFRSGSRERPKRA